MFVPGVVAIQKWNFPFLLVTNVTLEWANESDTESNAEASFAFVMCLNTYWFHNWSQQTQGNIHMCIDLHHQHSYHHFHMDY